MSSDRKPVLYTRLELDAMNDSTVITRLADLAGELLARGYAGAKMLDDQVGHLSQEWLATRRAAARAAAPPLLPDVESNGRVR